MSMEISFQKTKYLEFHPLNKDPLESTILDNIESTVKFEITYKYLGVEFHLNGKHSIFQEYYKTFYTR